MHSSKVPLSALEHGLDHLGFKPGKADGRQDIEAVRRLGSARTVLVGRKTQVDFRGP